jgi:hypothetical protein
LIVNAHERISSIRTAAAATTAATTGTATATATTTATTATTGCTTPGSTFTAAAFGSAAAPPGA